MLSLSLPEVRQVCVVPVEGVHAVLLCYSDMASMFEIWLDAFLSVVSEKFVERRKLITSRRKVPIFLSALR